MIPYMESFHVCQLLGTLNVPTGEQDFKLCSQLNSE